MSFSVLLSPQVLSALPRDIEQPTQIQRLAIPKLLTGNNVLALANTGSGKTLAFGLPVIEKLLASPTVSALILVPTRELAIQVKETLERVAQPLGIETMALCGGENKSAQIDALKQRPRLLVATTGRLLDLMKDDESAALLPLSALAMVTLDEADRLLDMGFWSDVVAIFARIPSNCQIAMFSATFSDELKAKAKQLMPHAVELHAAPTHGVDDATHGHDAHSSPIDETLYLVNKGSKPQALIALLKQHSDAQALAFIGEKGSADSLCKKLVKAGISAQALHSAKTQAERESTLAQFKAGEVSVLLATDVLARGIHIDALPLVINFDLPQHSEVYVHRIGRTARAGATGTALSLVCHSEAGALEAIRTLTKRELPLRPLDGFPVTDTPSEGTAKRAPKDKKANRRTQNKKSIKQFQRKA
ncbi:DEAD/DEAH box helicase [Vibrio sp. SM6]|uniref:DEAD/DEAH box helicase n=1 Tax=Vibrio agarilyticus TaxID=2726741 RepID=A0A7X8TQK0_9VIBR|nr:DEAD/DEAH box helicase [Vibrio agarilyticus]NLS12996.1 DEAD/DEAH box helicase [Vibrio agarilyticus]